MQTITVPTKTYKTLLQKARAFDKVLSVTKFAFPLDEYSGNDIAQFKKMDSVNVGEKRAILKIIKRARGGKKI